MKLKIIAFLCLMGFFCACAPGVDIFPESPEPLPAPAAGDRTVLVYVLADNSLRSFASADLDEMLEGIKMVDTGKNNLIVYIDRQEWNSARPIPSRLIRLCRNTNGEIIKDTIQTYDAWRNSAGVREMKEVFTYAFDHFPARQHGLVLWSHGDGWVPYPAKKTSRWVGQDKNNDSMDKRLNIDDLHTVLKSIPRLDYLLFDACLMQSIEVAYELRDRVDYFIGSPTELPGVGAPYQAVVPALFAASKPEIAIASVYFDHYDKKYKKGVGLSDDNWTAGVAVAVVQSNKLDALASATRGLSVYSSPAIDRTGILCYDPLREKYYYDMAGVMKAGAGDNTPAYQAWEAAYAAAVVYKKTTPLNYVTSPRGYGEMVSMTGFTGVSTYIPDGSNSYQDSYYRTLLWYRDTRAY